MKPRILFVDDEPALLRGLQRSLWELEDEWSMEFCECAPALLIALEKGGADVIVTDHNMPEMTGMQMVQEIRTNPNWDNVQIIFLTGNNDQSLKRQALEIGASDLLNKPVSTEDLLARIRASLKLKTALDALQRQNEVLESQVAARTKELETSQFEIVYRLAKAAEIRDIETANHTLRVSTSARLIAKTLGYNHREQCEIFLATMLHDVGKVGIPDNILLKPARLDPEEFDLMKTHASIGHFLLDSALEVPSFIHKEFGIGTLGGSAILQLGAIVASQHHEKFDGSGYPRGLQGDSIHPVARMVAVADVFDALRSERPYKAAMSKAEALQILRESSGSHFDPAMVEAFFGCQREVDEVYEVFKDYGEHDFLLAA